MKKKLAGKAWNITKKILSKLPLKFELTTRVLLKIGYEDEVALLPYLCNRNKISVDIGASGDVLLLSLTYVQCVANIFCVYERVNRLEEVSETR